MIIVASSSSLTHYKHTKMQTRAQKKYGMFLTIVVDPFQ